ncbi:MAG: hypothetical protein HND44_20245 [Chloroflexi bacterium]|nr:hypothetical protein [Ardenticatenaceae bacterium]NOG36876.1 hypothetical protein [Chloroflexota bacterium]
MPQLFLQISGLLALIVGVALAYWRWIRPYDGQISHHQQSLLLLYQRRA